MSSGDYSGYPSSDKCLEGSTMLVGIIGQVRAAGSHYDGVVHRCSEYLTTTTPAKDSYHSYGGWQQSILGCGQRTTATGITKMQAGPD